MLLSGLSFLVVNFFVKILGGGTEQQLIPKLQKYPAHELVLARSLVSFSISLFIIKSRGLPVFGNNRKWLLIRGVSGTIALTLFFYTLHFLPMAVASVIQYLSPIFTVILAMILLKEKVKSAQWFFILFSFVGVVLIGANNLFTHSEGEQLSFFWLGAGLISALFSGIAYTAIMKLRATDEPINIVMYFPMIAIPIMTLLCFFDFVFPTGIEWLFLLIIGVFTQMAQIMLTKALHYSDSSLVMPFQYLGAIYAFLIGYFVFDEALSLYINLGISIVFIGVLANIILHRK